MTNDLMHVANGTHNLVTYYYATSDCSSDIFKAKYVNVPNSDQTGCNEKSCQIDDDGVAYKQTCDKNLVWVYDAALLYKKPYIWAYEYPLSDDDAGLDKSDGDKCAPSSDTPTLASYGIGLDICFSSTFGDGSSCIYQSDPLELVCYKEPGCYGDVTWGVDFALTGDAHHLLFGDSCFEYVPAMPERR
ncbi:UNVERIFIED_CONTAM: hypothetical protein HDU68_004392 [Siphonaria sp. JEL0065]|nr:hypothetical protein HDU68_004392 [Siphonaria sp. JEL0065]